MGNVEEMNPYSDNWVQWVSLLSPTTCLPCQDIHGTLYAIDTQHKEPPLHPNCKCYIGFVCTIIAGTATTKGEEGADWYMFYEGKLPDYYITKEEAVEEGWVQKKKNLAKAVPGKMIGGGIYSNKDGKLPFAPYRIWYEADINYVEGKRNNERILYSNDGLIFVTYDHYKTFFELIE